MKDWKIYTRKGDQGETSLIGGRIVSKTCIRVESYGLVDELNAFTGNLFDQVSVPETRNFLEYIMNQLFLIESHLALDPDAPNDKLFPALTSHDTESLEHEIDRMNAALPDLSKFILPAGHTHVSQAHICRTVCRRAERSILRLNESEKVEPEIIKFMNRLSDYFFVLARYLAHGHKIPDICWVPKKES